MSSTEKRTQQSDDEDVGDSSFNEKNQQTTLPSKVVEQLELIAGDRIIYTLRKNGDLVIRRWPRTVEEKK